MKIILFALSAATALAGCAELERVNTVLGSSRATESIANLRYGAQALVCALADAAAVTAQVEAAVGVGDAVIGTTGNIFVGSGIICGALGGTLIGKGVVR